jgi:hypothetical protein
VGPNVTYDWCWQCGSYHRTEPGQKLNMQCKPVEPRKEDKPRDDRQQRQGLAGAGDELGGINPITRTGDRQEWT